MSKDSAKAFEKWVEPFQDEPLSTGKENYLKAFDQLDIDLLSSDHFNEIKQPFQSPAEKSESES